MGSYGSRWSAAAVRRHSPIVADAHHVPAVLTADLEERLRDLAERARAHGLHQLPEHVAAAGRHLLEPGQRRVRLVAVRGVEGGQPLQLPALLVLRRAGQLHPARQRARVRVDERVDPDDRQRPVVLALLVRHRLVLDAPALVAGLHRPQHAATPGQPLELGQHRLLDQVGQLVHQVRPLERVLGAGQPPLPVDDHLDRQRAPHRVRGRRRHRLVVGVGVQRVRVVVHRAQRLQRRADVVEVHLLRVQRAARRLHVVLQLLRALVGAVPLPHRDRPDRAGRPGRARCTPRPSRC